MPPAPLVRGVVPQFREEEGEAQRHLEDQGGEAGPTHELHDRKDSTVLPGDTSVPHGLAADRVTPWLSSPADIGDRLQVGAGTPRCNGGVGQNKAPQGLILAAPELPRQDSNL